MSEDSKKNRCQISKSQDVISRRILNKNTVLDMKIPPLYFFRSLFFALKKFALKMNLKNKISSKFHEKVVI